MFAKMINMARTPAEVKEQLKDYPVSAGEGSTPSVPSYPWGLSVSLEEESLSKLGMDKRMLTVGETLQIVCMMRVTSVSESESERSDGSKNSCCRVELQITDMGLPMADVADIEIERSAGRRKRFYGASEPDGDED